ncbi:TolC family protein [Chryseobacterium sp. JV274]|uniref:TolC family protein n=1 Tax=Chryseobacterium sp. JV274 TaxID=1932669 RepID=UPI0015D73349|nr:TolC family protein [Chryseobacterium sp. JV274]
MNKKHLFLFLLIFGIKTSSQITFTLKQCVEYGLQHNRNNIIYMNEKLAADAKAKEILANYLPKVDISSTLNNNLKLQQSIIPAGVFGSDEIHASLEQKYNSNAFIQLEQPVFDQAILTRLKNNKYLKEQSSLNIQQSQENIIYSISTAYFQILVYKQQFEQLEFNQNNYLKLIEIYQLQVKKGTILQKDLDKIIVDSNNIIAQMRVAKSNITLAQNQLKYEMGFPLGDKIELDTPTELQLGLFHENSQNTFNPNSRVDYKLSELHIKILEIEKSAIRAEMLPKLSLNFQYGAVGFGDKFSQVYSNFYPYSTIGLKLSIPILNFYKNNAQYTQADISKKNVEEKLKLAEGKIIIEYENAKTKLLQAQTNVENGLRNINLAKSVLKVTDLQLQKGVTTLTDWLNTQNSFRETQSTYLTALYTYYQSRIDLELAGGTLKNFYQSY